jgi:hypothetical protein
MCDQTDGTLPLHGCCYSCVCVFVDLSVCASHSLCIAIDTSSLSLSLSDAPQSVYHTAALLRRYHPYLSASEQAGLLARLTRLMAALVPALGPSPAAGRAAPLPPGALEGFPAILAMEYCPYAE